MPVDHKGSKIFIIICAAATTLSILLIMGSILITVLANKNTIEHNKLVIEDSQASINNMHHPDCIE